MNLSVGIVGLPNVGKSTLFNALLKKQVALVANYPFATIEPNVGVVEVPDERLPVLAKIVQTEKIVPAAIEFYDIAGLVKGASQGEGLGNQFLAKIREVQAVCHVLRCFSDPLIIKQGAIGPKDDFNTVTTELGLSDLDHPGAPPFAQKPAIIVLNLDEKDLPEADMIEAKYAAELGVRRGQIIAINAKLEAEMADFSAEEQKEILNQYALPDTGLNRLIKVAYGTLGLMSFLTAGKLEARAWTIAAGTPAQEAAGVIHTDFIKNFIKADVVEYADFVKIGGWTKAREAGLVKTVGRDYQLQNGQVVEFKIGS